jgi:hypothetical protein
MIDDIFTARIHSNSVSNYNMFKYADKDGFRSGKQCLSVILPPISFTGKTEFS